MCVYIYIYICLHIYIYIYAHTHTTHTHTSLPPDQIRRQDEATKKRDAVSPQAPQTREKWDAVQSPQRAGAYDDFAKSTGDEINKSTEPLTKSTSPVPGADKSIEPLSKSTEPLSKSTEPLWYLSEKSTLEEIRRFIREENLSVKTSRQKKACVCVCVCVNISENSDQHRLNNENV